MKEQLKKIKGKKFFRDKNALCRKLNTGWTIAHERASLGWIIKDIEILKMADKNGWTVAHEMAANGWETNDEEIMKLSDKDGWTVAHEMAMNSKSVLDNKTLLQYEILTLKDNIKKSVFDILLEKYHDDFLNKLDYEIRGKLIL